ncbi:MAG: type II and III secretion system protein [Candidatus Dependentiae bacterium]|jgi:type II secretory pathway component GspD/PulD (secretin)
MKYFFKIPAYSRVLFCAVAAFIAVAPTSPTNELLNDPAKLEALVERVENAGQQRNRTVAQVNAHLENQYENPLLQTPVTCAHHGQPLAAVLTDLAQQSGLTLILDEAVKGTVPVCIAQQEKLATVLRNLLAGRSPALALTLEGRTLRIALRTTLCAYLKTLPHNGLSYQERIIHLRHRCVTEQLLFRLERCWKESAPAHAKDLFFHGDEQQRCIVVRGATDHVTAFAQLVRQLDAPPHQVQLQARVVLADETFLQGAGIDWQLGCDLRAGSGRGFNLAGVGDVAGRALPWALHLFPSANLLKTVELPLVLGGSDLATKRLNIILNAAEQRKKVRTLLQPTLLVEDGQQAELLDGRVVPVESMVEEAVEGRVRNVRSAQYKEVGMQLRVRPTVHDSGNVVYLDIAVENSHVLPDSGNYPSIATTRTKNKVRLRSGQTAVIGGLVTTRTAYDRQAVPWISQVPVVGWLFRGWRREQQRSQLLVVITAKAL